MSAREKRRWEPPDGLRVLEVQGHGPERVVYCTHCQATIIPTDAELKPTRMRDCALRHWRSRCDHPGTQQLANNTTVESALVLTVEVFCTCAKPYNTNQGGMIRCRLCAGWFHPGCIGLKAKAKQDAMKNYHRFVCPPCCDSLANNDCACVVRAAFTTASPCGGVNHEVMALLNLQLLDLAPVHSHEWGAEIDTDARLLVEALSRCTPGYAPEAAHRDLLRVRVGSLECVTLTTVGFPCEESSPLLNGHETPKSLSKSNLLLAKKLEEVLAAGLTEFIIIECDHKFFSDHSVPFQHMRAGMAAGGYVVVLKRTLSPTAFGHPQIRSRTYFVATKHNLKHELVDTHIDRCLHCTLCATCCALSTVL